MFLCLAKWPPGDRPPCRRANRADMQILLELLEFCKGLIERYKETLQTV